MKKLKIYITQLLGCLILLIKSQTVVAQQNSALQDTITYLKSEIESYKFELENAANNAKNDLQALRSQQEVMTKQNSEIRLLRQKLSDSNTRIPDNSQLLIQKDKEISELKAANEELQEKYIRLQHGTEAVLNSPAYQHRTAIVDGGTKTEHSYRPHTSSAPRVSSSRQYYTGPRGGCFYYTSTGRKEYADHSLCR